MTPSRSSPKTCIILIYLKGPGSLPMQAKLLTGWQCNSFILQEKGSFNRSLNIIQATLKSWVQHIKTIPGNLLLIASWYQPGFRDLAFTSRSFKTFDMSNERAGWLGSRDLGKRPGNFAIWALHPGYPDERRDEFWRSGWHCLALPAVFCTS